MSAGGKHRWGEPVQFPYKTERACLNGCGIVKVTRHEAEGGRDIYWNEYWRDGDKIPGGARPTCIPVATHSVVDGATHSVVDGATGATGAAPAARPSENLA